MAKNITITAVNGCIRYKGTDYLPGTPFQCDAVEAKRLIGMEVAALAAKVETTVATGPTAEELAAQTAAAEKAALLASIAAAADETELAELMPEEAPDQEIQEAFAKRLNELAEA